MIYGKIESALNGQVLSTMYQLHFEKSSLWNILTYNKRVEIKYKKIPQILKA